MALSSHDIFHNSRGFYSEQCCFLSLWLYFVFCGQNLPTISFNIRGGSCKWSGNFPSCIVRLKHASVHSCARFRSLMTSHLHRNSQFVIGRSRLPQRVRTITCGISEAFSSVWKFSLSVCLCVNISVYAGERGDVGWTCMSTSIVWQWGTMLTLTLLQVNSSCRIFSRVKRSRPCTFQQLLSVGFLSELSCFFVCFVLWPGLSKSHSVHFHQPIQSCFLLRTSCKPSSPQTKCDVVIPESTHHHLGRYSCGRPLKFLLWSAWSTVKMKESIMRLMSGVNGSKEGLWAPGRLKWPSWLLCAHSSLSSVMETFRKAATSRSWGNRALCSSS